MKKVFALVLAGVLAVSMLCGCDTQGSPAESTNPSETEVTYPYDFTSEDFFYVKDFLSYDYIPSAPLEGVKADGSFFQLNSVEGFNVMQGGCTDGTYGYFILEDQSYTEIEGATTGHVIFKVDMTTWEVVDQSEPLALDHGNGMCYNAKIDRLIVAHCNNYPNDVSYVDPDTLEIVDRKTLPMAINAIDYNEKHDLYVVGIKGNSAAFAVLDLDDNGEFVELGYYEGHQLGLVSQDVDCDDNYIYVGNSSVGTEYSGMEAVKIYNWDGEYQGIFLVESMSEQEALFNYNGTYYITFFTGTGGRVYKVNYDFSLLAD